MRADPFSLLTSALLRPSEFRRFLARGRRNIALGAAAAALWIGVGWAFAVLIVPDMAALRSKAFGYGVIGAVLPGMLASFGVMAGRPARDEPDAHASFWILRSQLAYAPSLVVALPLATHYELMGQSSRWLVASSVGWIGLLIGSMLTVALLTQPRRLHIAMVRWLTGGVCLIMSIQFLTAFPPSLFETQLLVASFAGLAVGALRPLSWIWAAAWSLALAAGAGLGVAPQRLCDLHPARFDELCLLPLPGTVRLARSLGEADTAAACAWLLALAG
ncbi:MAG TPA: hypothetical protein VGE07_04010, partial [Herpetosiphonaceae bacterium]